MIELNIVWSVFEIFASLFQGFLFTAFTRKFLKTKQSKRTDILTYITTSLVLSASFIVSNYVTHFEGVAVLLFCIPLLIYSFYFLNGSPAQKIIASVIPILSNVIVASLTFTVIARAFTMTVHDLLSEPSLERFLLIIIGNLILAYALSAISRLSRKNKIKLSKGEIFLNLAVLLISIVIFTLLNWMGMDSTQSRNHSILLLGCMLGLILIDIVVFYLVSQLSKSHEIKSRNELLSQQLAYQDKYTETSKQQYKTVLHIRHDIKHSMSVLDVLLTNNENDEAKAFIKKYIQFNSPTFMLVSTQNAVLNAIVSQKMSYANSLGIKTFCVLPEIFTMMDDIDLCNLIGNMLDNAIEYCQKHLNEANEISILIRNEEKKEIILVKNTIHNSVLANNIQLNTNKKNQAEHGFGIETIRNIAGKYNGVFDCYEDSQTFYSKVVLPSD